jgi:5-formyltetrahydrofolate cyclo-ligase
MVPPENSSPALVSKADLRREFRARRDNLPLGLRELWSRRILARLEEHSDYLASRHPALTLGVGGEVLTHLLIESRLSQGKPVLLPRTDGQGGMTFHRVSRPLDSLAPGTHRIPEPDPSRDSEVSPAEIDLAIVPGIAFDPRGYRLGQGGGYFDRFLDGLGSQVPTLGLAFDMQMTVELPVDPHDRPVREVLTERTIYAVQEKTWTSRSVAETHATAALLAKTLSPPGTLRLVGELGAGKTEFVRGFLAALGWQGRVKSPTFTLENVYPVGEEFQAYHLDGYRLDSPSDLDFQSLAEILEDPRNLVLVEWPDRFGGALPAFSPLLEFNRRPEGSREIHWRAFEKKHHLS